MTVNELKNAIRLQGKVEIVRFDEETGEAVTHFRTYDFDAEPIPAELLDNTIVAMYGVADEEAAGIMIEIE